MSEHDQASKTAGDGMADAIVATTVITVIVVTLVFWLSGFPA
jgi:hypothetical protein